MQAPLNPKGSSNPHDVSLHKQVKDISDLLRPELLRLHKALKENSGNVQLYVSVIAQIKGVRKEITNHDALFSFQNMICHMQKSIELAQKNSVNQEILWHLQEVMALLFKVQNFPS